MLAVKPSGTHLVLEIGRVGALALQLVLDTHSRSLGTHMDRMAGRLRRTST